MSWPGSCARRSEYLEGDTGQGLGASRQTGWTGLVVTRLDDLGWDLRALGLGRC